MKRDNRKETALTVKLFMAQNGISVDDIAKATLLKRGTVRNIVNGGNTSTMGRERVATFLGKSFWPGVEPASVGLGQKQRALLERVATAAEALAERFEQAATPEDREKILAEYEALLTPEVLSAAAKTESIPLVLNLRLSRALMPWFHATTTPEERTLPPGSVRVRVVDSAPNETTAPIS